MKSALYDSFEVFQQRMMKLSESSNAETGTPHMEKMQILSHAP